MILLCFCITLELGDDLVEAFSVATVDLSLVQKILKNGFGVLHRLSKRLRMFSRILLLDRSVFLSLVLILIDLINIAQSIYLIFELVNQIFILLAFLILK